MTRRQIMLVFYGTVLGMMLAALDQTIVATALPAIVADLHGFEHLSWVVHVDQALQLHHRVHEPVGSNPGHSATILGFGRWRTSYRCRLPVQEV